MSGLRLYTPTEIEGMKSAIDGLSHEEMAALQRFSGAGHPYFRGELYEHFKKRFDAFGGMTPEISKKIGWS